MKHASENKKNASKIYNGIKYIFYPIVYFLLVAVTLVFAFGPVVSPYLGLLELMIVDDVSDLGFNKEHVNILDLVKAPEETGETVSIFDVYLPGIGDQYGKMKIPDISVDSKVFYGDSTSILRKGLGTSPMSYVPGQGKTIIIGGHNNSDFRKLKNIKTGAKIEIQTSYGLYEYEVTETKQGRYDDKDVYDLKRKEENLILYTCIKWAAAGSTPYRFFVFAKKVSGPAIVE